MGGGSGICHKEETMRRYYGLFCNFPSITQSVFPLYLLHIHISLPQTRPNPSFLKYHGPWCSCLFVNVQIFPFNIYHKKGSRKRCLEGSSVSQTYSSPPSLYGDSPVSHILAWKFPFWLLFW